MKKILILLTLLIALTFSGTSVANCDCYIYKCKITYTQQKPAKEAKNVGVTIEVYDKKYCKKGSDKILKKIEKWLSKDKNYLITDFSSAVKCKSRDDLTWNVYHKCKPEYKDDLIKDLKKDYPNQVLIDDTN
jgi:uncharacterized protein YxeA